MFNNIYKDMIEDSPIPYIHIKIVKDELGDSKHIKIKNYNKAYEKAWIKNNDISYINNIIKPRNEKEKARWDKLPEIMSGNKKFTIEEHVDSLDKYLNVDIYRESDDEFHIRLSNVSVQHIKLSASLKNSSFMVFIKDRDGRYLDVNDAMLEILNKSYDDIVGKTNFDLLDRRWAEEHKKQDEQVLRERKMFKFEDCISGYLNEDSYYEMIKWPYMNEDETIVLGIIGICVTTTEEVKLRKQLEETEKRFLEIANNINDIIIIRNEEKAEYINPAFERVYGIKPDELYEDINKWYKYWDSVEFEKEIIPYSYKEKDETTFKVTKEGQEDKWLWSRFVPILDENGNLIRKIGILSDITESKTLEEELYKMKMDFFANLSHELRTPINLIFSALQVLGLKFDRLDPEMYEYFDKYMFIIGQNGHRLLRLVNNLIDTTKLDSGCFDYNPENNDIVRCVEDICMSVSSFVDENKLEIIFDTDEEEKIVSFDPDNMERIMLNLLSNAIKFSKANEKIEVNISCKDNINISVKDKGVGIPSDKLDSIFGRFEQVKSKSKKEREGSGIGLALVKSLVEMHDGNISVNSTPGKGSEFIITLPDVLAEAQYVDKIKQATYMSNVNRLRTELSDIYK